MKCTGRNCPMTIGKIEHTVCSAEGCPWRTAPITNADRIRAMTDEELAEWLAKHMYCAECMFFNDETGTCNYEYRYGKGCNGAMLEWLKQDANDCCPL